LDVGKQGVKDGDLVGGMLCADGFPRVVDGGDAASDAESEALVVRLAEAMTTSTVQVCKSTSNQPQPSTQESGDTDDFYFESMSASSATLCNFIYQSLDYQIGFAFNILPRVKAELDAHATLPCSSGSDGFILRSRRYSNRFSGVPS
jgi:hypothetical protein